MTHDYRTVTGRIDRMTKALLRARDSLPDGIVKHYARNAAREMMTVHKELQYAQGNGFAYHPEVFERLTADMLAAMTYSYEPEPIIIDPRLENYRNMIEAERSERSERGERDE